MASVTKEDSVVLHQLSDAAVRSGKCPEQSFTQASPGGIKVKSEALEMVDPPSVFKVQAIYIKGEPEDENEKVSIKEEPFLYGNEASSTRYLPCLSCKVEANVEVHNSHQNSSQNISAHFSNQASTPSISNENETSLMFSDTFEVPSDDSTFQQVQLPGLEHVECPHKGDNSNPTGQLDSAGRAEHAIIRPAVQPQRVMRSPTPTSDSSTSQPNEPKSVEFSRRPPLNKAQKRKCAEDSEAEILQMVSTSLKEDELGEMTWGREIGKDVAKLNREQSIIAKKLIRDAIFYSSLNMLKPHTRLTDLD